jgi:MFS family permease
MVAGPMLIYRLTDSPALLGTSSLVGAVPMLGVSLFGGAIADRIPKKWILVVALILFAMTSIAIALTLETGLLSREREGSWWILMLIYVFQGTLMGTMMPALQAVIPEIVSSQNLTNAVALNMMGMNIMNLVAPAIAGFMVDSLGFEAIYYTIAGLYMYAAVFFLFIPVSGKVTAVRSNIISDIKEGLRYMRRNSLILFMLSFTLGVVVLSMPYQQLLPIFADDILKVGASGMGVMLSVSGGGALAASLLLTAITNKKRGILMVSSGIISGLSLLVFALSSSYTLSLAAMVFVGVGQTLRSTIGSTLLQVYTEPKYMGRVMSVLNIQWGVMSLCTFLAGILAAVVAVPYVLGGLAFILIVLSILSMIFRPDIRKLD